MMTVFEARNELSFGPPSPNRPSAVNPSFTQQHFCDTLIEAIAKKDSSEELSPIMEKRVHQAVLNQRRPRY